MQAVAPDPSRTADHLGAVAGHAGFGGGRGRGHAPCVAQQFFARGGGTCAPADPLQQPQAVSLLELAHLLAHRGLAQAETVGRGRKAAEFADQREAAQVIGMQQRTHTKVLLMQWISRQSFPYSMALR